MKHLKPQIGPKMTGKTGSNYPRTLGRGDDHEVPLPDEATMKSDTSGLSNLLPNSNPLIQIQGRALGTSYSSVSLAGLGLDEIPPSVNLFKNASVVNQ